MQAMLVPRALCWLVLSCVLACARGQGTGGVTMDVYGNLALASLPGQTCTCNSVDLLATMKSLQSTETSLETQLSAALSTNAVLSTQV